MTRREFDAMLESLARGWTERDYGNVISFFFRRSILFGLAELYFS